MIWRKKENTYLWSKESDKRNALYVNLCTIRQRESNEPECKNERTSIDLCTLADAELYRHPNCWANALSIYSKALLFARSNEQLGHSYAKRSVCFYKMKFYKESLVDLDLARLHRYSKIDDYDEQQTICLQLLEVTRPATPCIPTLSYVSHEKFPGLANVLKIQRNREYGMHIVATEDIDVGKTVVMERAFMTVAVGNEQRCSKCFRTHTNLVPCKKCTVSTYIVPFFVVFSF